MNRRRPSQRPDDVERVELDLVVGDPLRVGAPTEAPPRLGSLRGRDLSYIRAGRVILDRVNVTAAPGEALAVTGPSGSGKTTLLALLAGLERPDSGSVERDPPNVPIALILQAYGLVSLLTAAENVEIVLQPDAGAGTLDRRDVADRAAAALDLVGLGSVADHLVEELSGGQQQRVAIARALVTDPAILVADEFTSELDHDTKEHVMDLVLDVAGRGGITVIATHDPEVAGRCDRQLPLVDGHARGLA